MTGARARPRVALVAHAAARALAPALQAEGIAADVVDTRRLPALDALLARRGFTEPLTHVPLLAGRLLAGGYDVVHASAPADAAAALVWRRLTQRPIVFTCAETLTRATLADRRLRLRLLADAVERSDAVVAPTVAAREALLRWMAVDAELIEPGDGAAHAALYRSLAATRRPS